MSKAAGDMATLQGKVASGLNYTKPSEAPDVVGRAVALESRIKGFSNEVEAVAKVKLGIDTQASALEAGQTLLARLKELSLQGASGQYAQSDRASMAAEVGSIKASLMNLANAKDPDGRYVFGGTSSSAEPYTQALDGSVTYTGSGSPLRVHLGDSAYEDASVVGPAVWQGVTRPQTSTEQATKVDVFGVVSDLEAALKSNDKQHLARSIDELSQVSDNVMATMSKLGASQNRLALAESQAQELSTRATEALSSIKDLDYATALGDLKKQETLLQASQSLLGRLSQLSLLEYMR
jgi:flagellar hook-associated protein 3 FlgL